MTFLVVPDEPQETVIQTEEGPVRRSTLQALNEFVALRGRPLAKSDTIKLIEENTIRILDELFPRRFFCKNSQQNEVLGPVFSKVVIAVILCNCIEIGATCQWYPTNGGTLQKVYITCEIIFTSFYFAEAFMKMRVLGLKGYFTKGLAHPLELLVAICGAMQVTLELYQTEHVPETVKAVVKATSLLRILRIFRALSFLTNIPELAITIGGLMGSFRTLWWVLFVMVLFVYAFSVYFVIQVDDTGSLYWCDLLTAMQTMASVVVVNKWAHVLKMDENSEKTAESDPARLTLLHLPFYAFGLLTVFGVTNIIIGVIVEATSGTKRELNWSRTRAILVRVATAWESLSKSQGLEHLLENTSGEPDPELHASRQAVLKAILDSIITSGDMNDIFPPGMTGEEFRMLLDYEGDGVITHHEFCVALGRLLLCDEMQLRILALVQQGQTRRQVRKSLDQLAELKLRMDTLEDTMAKRMNAGFSKIKQVLATKSATCPVCAFNT